MSEADVEAILAVPWIAVCTDAAGQRPGHPALGSGMPHPRAYGSAPRVLGRYVRERRDRSRSRLRPSPSSPRCPAERLGLQRSRGAPAEGLRRPGRVRSADGPRRGQRSRSASLPDRDRAGHRQRRRGHPRWPGDGSSCRTTVAAGRMTRAVPGDRRPTAARCRDSRPPSALDLPGGPARLRPPAVTAGEPAAPGGRSDPRGHRDDPGGASGRARRRGPRRAVPARARDLDPAPPVQPRAGTRGRGRLGVRGAGRRCPAPVSRRGPCPPGRAGRSRRPSLGGAVRLDGTGRGDRRRRPRLGGPRDRRPGRAGRSTPACRRPRVVAP